MIRTAVIALAALAAVAAADPKPKPTIAIIVDAKDRDAIPTADELTASLRKLAGKKAERFAVKGTDKDWIAAKRAAECSAMQLGCAVTIGASLGVDFVAVGVAETRAQHRVIVINLVNVSTKQRVRSLRDTVTTQVKLQKWAQKIYERVISNDTGEIVVITNAKGGDVLIDGQLIAALYEGKATLPNLAVGTHALTIRAPGFKLLETEVTVDGSTRESILLEPLP